MTDGHTNHGKWSQPGVPHKNWKCVGFEDLREPSELCGMCESIEIRHVHYMQHPDYPEILGVGCVCAEHMEQDYVGPRLRERRSRSAAKRRMTWARRTWHISAKGNSYLNVEGFNLTIFSIPNAAERRWGIRVIHRESGREQFGRRNYQSLETAKDAAFDALIWAKEHLID